MPRKPTSLYYGWYIVIALAITETVSFGVLYYAFTVFITPMQADMGWTLAQITGAFSAALFVSGVITLPVGTWLDKYGARLLMTLASVLATLLMVAWAFVETLPLFYAIWILLGVTMAMLFYDPAFVVVANWFQQYRSRALAIVTLMAGFASTIFLPLTDYLVVQYGWRTAVLVLAAILGCVTIPLHGIVLRRRPVDMGLAIDGNAGDFSSPSPTDETTSVSEAQKDKHDDHTVRDAILAAPFLWMTLGFSFAFLASIGLRVHFIPLLIDEGFASTQAAWIAGIIGIMQVVGRLFFAPVEARLSGRLTTLIIMGAMTLSFVLLLISTEPWAVWTFVVLFGASVGAITLARPVMVSSMYDVRHFGRINAVMGFVLSLVITIAPIGAGALYEWTSSYTPVLWGFLLFSIASVLAIVRLPVFSASQTAS